MSINTPAGEALKPDIVERLREIAATPPGKQSLWDCTVAAWAADEIERLRRPSADPAVEVTRAADAVNKLAVRKAQNDASLHGNNLYRDFMTPENRKLDEAFQSLSEVAADPAAVEAARVAERVIFQADELRLKPFVNWEEAVLLARALLASINQTQKESK